MSTGSSNDPEIAVTGNFWMGRGTGSISSMLKDTFRKAREEIQIAAYSISENPEDLVKLFDSALVRGIRIVFIINRFSKQPESARRMITELARKHHNFIIRDFSPGDFREDLHAKLVVVDREIALVGSANLTFKGMVMNHELLIRISGKTASKIGDLLDMLSRRSDPIKLTARLG